MSEIKKPVITKEQARAIEEGLKCYVRQGLDFVPKLYNRFLIDHANVLTEVDDPWADMFSCLNELDLATLAAALINGYEVEKTPEEKVREYFKELSTDIQHYLEFGERELAETKMAERATALKILDLLGMKVVGGDI
ncbi:hypothetical protein MOD67_13850 [Bacillus licheniformis]|nr:MULTISPECIES: hypothetical protein [Bacillus]MCY8291565.1 hypothetical protein [Bacillus haynesii]MCY8745064.1 hypothetical protein [Bacillus licheniformis]